MTNHASNLEILEEFLSSSENLRPQSISDQKTLKDLRKKTKHMIYLIKHPEMRIAEEFKERISIGFDKPSEISGKYLDFLWPYLLCCFFSVKYKGEFGNSFPPNDQDFYKLAEIIIDSYRTDDRKKTKKY